MIDDKPTKAGLVDPIEERKTLEKDHKMKRSETGPSDRQRPEETPARKPLFGR
jgi:hypothetical protein